MNSYIWSVYCGHRRKDAKWVGVITTYTKDEKKLIDQARSEFRIPKWFCCWVNFEYES